MLWCWSVCYYYQHIITSWGSHNLSRLLNRTESEFLMETMPLNEGVTTTSYQSAENESAFICNICLEITNKDPVVTQCGHLYCWPCLYRWLNTQQTPCCPVCKAGRPRLKFWNIIFCRIVYVYFLWDAIIMHFMHWYHRVFLTIHFLTGNFKFDNDANLHTTPVIFFALFWQILRC